MHIFLQQLVEETHWTVHATRCRRGSDPRVSTVHVEDGAIQHPETSLCQAWINVRSSFRTRPNTLDGSHPRDRMHIRHLQNGFSNLIFHIPNKRMRKMDHKKNKIRGARERPTQSYPSGGRLNAGFS